MQLSKLYLATKKILSAMVITTTVLSTTPIQKINLKGSEINVSAAVETKISNPRIVKDSSLKSGQKVTWDCIYFGSYPQTEIVDNPHRSGAFAKKWEEEDDYEIDSSVYSKLKNATGWDSNGDITIDNVKYRRLSSDDTTYKFPSDQEGYYNWDKDNDTKYHYFRYEKIKWRVLNVDGNEALLLSDKILDTQKYDTWHETTWEKSIIRSWLNGYKGSQNSKLWMENDDSGCKFYSSVKTKDGYSAPVNIYTQQGVNGNYFTATLDDNGEWDIILNAQDSNDDEKTSMFYIHKKSAPKIAIEDMSIDGNDMENGEQPVLYTVTNQSEETIKSFNLKISNDDGEIVNKTVSCNLLPGESKLFEDKFSFDNITRIENFTVETVADGQKDTSQSQLKEEVSYTDLGITDVKKTITKDGVQYTATVTNNGQVAASGIIDFYKDNKLSDKLTTKAVSTIQAGESKKVTFNYKTSDMKFDEDQNTYCSMKLSSDDEKDSNSQNDSYYGVIYRWELPGQNDISDCTVKLSSEQFTEDGLAKEPDITVKRGNLLLEKGTDYQVEYHNNVKAGMAVVAITGINRYVGRIERSYVINVVQKDHNQNNNSTENKSDKSNLIKPIVKVDKITINGISKQIAAGKSIKLTASILPKNAKTKSVAWKTSNKKVATVNKNGVVKINKRAAGKTVTITAIAKDGSNKKATYKIKVMKGSVKSISIKGKKTVKAGKTLKLTAKVKASKGANKKLIWKSSNTKYATVSSSGKVKTKKTGKKKTVKITVMSTDGTNKKKTVKIKIK